MPRAGDQVGRSHVQLLVRVMRMGADRAKDIGEAICDRQQFMMTTNAGRDRDHPPDTGGARASNDSVELVGKIRKVEMAVAVNEHGFEHGYCAALAAGST